MSAFTFVPLTAADLPRIELWLHRPHVREAFGEPEVWLSEISANLVSTWVRHFRADWNEQPAGFVQFYDAALAPAGAWSNEPPGTFGIDFFLGETELLGRGLGTALLREFAAFVVAAAPVRRLVLDPEPHNVRSLRAARGAGFVHDPGSGLWILE